MKKGLKRQLVKSFKACVSILVIIQKFLMATIVLLKRSSSRLKQELSVVLGYVPGLKTRIVTMLSCALQFVAIHVIKKRKHALTVLLVSVLLVLNLFFLNTITGQLFVKTNLYSYGTIQLQTIGVKAYQDITCTTPVSEVAWGTLTPGLSKTNLVYIKNEGTSLLTLSFDTAKWNPANAPDHLTLKWDYDGAIMSPNQVMPIELTLSVSQNITGIESFSFEITIYGKS